MLETATGSFYRAVRDGHSEKADSEKRAGAGGNIRQAAGPGSYFVPPLAGEVRRCGGLVKSRPSFCFLAKRTNSQWSVNFWW